MKLLLYDVLIKFIPIIEKIFGWIAFLLFIFWIFQTHNKKYIDSLRRKAIRDYNEQSFRILQYNSDNPSHQVQITSGWFDLYKVYLARRNNTLLFSIVLAYLSFNATSYRQNDNDTFFKLLTISTTLFLAGITYIQQRYRE